MGVERGEEIYLHRLIDACVIRMRPGPRHGVTGTVDFLIQPEVSVDGSALARVA